MCGVEITYFGGGGCKILIIIVFREELKISVNYYEMCSFGIFADVLNFYG